MNFIAGESNQLEAVIVQISSSERTKHKERPESTIRRRNFMDEMNEPTRKRQNTSHHQAGGIMRKASEILLKQKHVTVNRKAIWICQRLLKAYVFKNKITL